MKTRQEFTARGWNADEDDGEKSQNSDSTEADVQFVRPDAGEVPIEDRIEETPVREVPTEGASVDVPALNVVDLAEEIPIKEVSSEELLAWSS